MFLVSHVTYSITEYILYSIRFVVASISSSKRKGIRVGGDVRFEREKRRERSKVAAN